MVTTAHSAMEGWPALTLGPWASKSRRVQKDCYNCGAFVCRFAENFVTPKEGRRKVDLADGDRTREKTLRLFERLRDAAETGRATLRERATS